LPIHDISALLVVVWKGDLKLLLIQLFPLNAYPKSLLNEFSSKLYFIFFVRGAIWLYRATQNVTYLNEAKSFYNQYGVSGAGDFSWDNKAAGVQVLEKQPSFWMKNKIVNISGNVG
jgi:hypothetical protein